MSDSSIAFDRTIRLMQDRLSLNSFNQEVISGNLANINTPGYVAKDVSFERILQDSLNDQTLRMRTSDDGHVDPTSPTDAIRSPDVVETGPVDLDHEMMKLTKNSIEYQFIATMLNKKFSLLRQAIGEGGQ
jgi:flagellar basal-body rod protein FlgB